MTMGDQDDGSGTGALQALWGKVAGPKRDARGPKGRKRRDKEVKKRSTGQGTGPTLRLFVKADKEEEVRGGTHPHRTDQGEFDDEAWLERRRKNRRKMRRAGSGSELRHRSDEDLSRRFLVWYEHVCYHLLGERLDQDLDRRLETRLKQADYHVSPGLYRAMQYITSIAVAAFSFLVTTLLLGVLLSVETWYVYVASITFLGTIATFFSFPFTVTTRIQNRKTELEKELPFAISELSVLASIGLSPIAIMRRMAGRGHDPAVTGEFKKVVYKTDVQGKDVVAALGDTAKGIPSPIMSELFWDLGNMIHQGGDLGEYLQKKSESVLTFKRTVQEEFIERLQGYSDMYVTVVLIGVIFIGIAAFLMDAFGMEAGGLDGDALLQLMAYGVMPLIVVVVGILLNSAFSQHD